MGRLVGLWEHRAKARGVRVAGRFGRGACMRPEVRWTKVRRTGAWLPMFA